MILKSSYITKDQISLNQGYVSRLGDKQVSNLEDRLLIGSHYEKYHIFRLSCTFYYKKVHVKTSWEGNSPS